MGASRAVIVTGADGAVGRACAKAIARAGDGLYLVGDDEERLRAAAAEVAASGGTAETIAASPGDALDVHNIIAGALDAYGRIDGLIQCAAIVNPSPFLETTADEFDAVLNVNLRGAFLLGQAVAKEMVREREEEGADTRSRTIVNVSSVEAVTADPRHAAYAASQGGLNQLTRAMAVALAPKGVRVNAVGLGAMQGAAGSEGYADKGVRKRIAGSTPIGRVGDPAEAGDVVAFLMSDAASFVIGQCIYVDGGRLIYGGGGEGGAQ